MKYIAPIVLLALGAGLGCEEKPVELPPTPAPLTLDQTIAAEPNDAYLHIWDLDDDATKTFLEQYPSDKLCKLLVLCSESGTDRFWNPWPDRGGNPWDQTGNFHRWCEAHKQFDTATGLNQLVQQFGQPHAVCGVAQFEQRLSDTPLTYDMQEHIAYPQPTYRQTVMYRLRDNKIDALDADTTRLLIYDPYQQFTDVHNWPASGAYFIYAYDTKTQTLVRQFTGEWWPGLFAYGEEE